jgi:hypothetical protein
MPFNLLDPNKKLSQLLAQSWLDGQDLNINKDWLVEKGIISPDEAGNYEVEVDSNPEPKPDPGKPDGPKYIGLITLTEEGKLHMYIPYPKRPDEGKVSNEDLEQWVNDSDPNHPIPANIWIPYSC